MEIYHILVVNNIIQDAPILIFSALDKIFWERC